VRPLAIAEASLPPSSTIDWFGTGFLAASDHAIRVFDQDLDVEFEVHSGGVDPIRAAAVAPNRSRIALMVSGEVQVHEPGGHMQWHMQHHALSDGWPPPTCHLTEDDLLWLFLPGSTGDRLVVHDAGTGKEIGHCRLPTEEGFARFLPHPDSTHLGMHISMGPETSISFWLTVTSRRLAVRETAAACLADITAAGDAYLAMPHGTGWISIRDFADGEVRVQRGYDDIPGYDEPDVVLHETAAVVCDDSVMVAAATGRRDGGEHHLLLSTRTLSCQTVVEYDMAMAPDSIRPAGGQGRWLTHDFRSGAVRLWQPRKAYGEEVDGQLPLWDFAGELVQ
jgi:hypothetical protein